MMTPQKRERLKELQNIRGLRSASEQAELNSLCRELALEPEVADNPMTPFVDESSRPKTGGGNYNDNLHAMTCAEVEAILLRVGRVAFDAAVAAVLAK